MHKKDLKFEIRYLHCLFYRARLFLSHIERSSKASKKWWNLQKQKDFKDTLKGSNTITDLEEDEEEENEHD